VVYGSTLAAPLAAQFETDLKSASPVKDDRRRNFLARLGEATARVFSPLL
jgi:cardiolipin synthase A/B